MAFVGNFILCPIVEEFGNYLENLQILRREFGVLLF